MGTKAITGIKKIFVAKKFYKVRVEHTAEELWLVKAKNKTEARRSVEMVTNDAVDTDSKKEVTFLKFVSTGIVGYHIEELE